MRFLMVMLGCAGLAACGPEHDLVVELRSDYLAGVEVSEARTLRIDEGDEVEVARAPLRGELSQGVRVAELPGLAPGVYRIRVELLGPLGAVAEREVSVDLRASQAVTVVVDRGCAGIRCPQACLAGLCVPYACTPETPQRCPDEALCDADAECDPPPASCAEGRCVAGACLARPVAGACGADAYCDPETGCARVDASADAGAPPPDAGPACAAGTADCDADPSDCEVDVMSSRAHCGACGVACAPAQRCVAGACEAAVQAERIGVTTSSEGGRGLLFALAARPDGRFSVAGRLRGRVQVDGRTLETERDAAVVLSFSAAGALESTLFFPGAANSSANGLDLGAAPDLWLAGELRGAVGLPGGPMLGATSLDPFWAAYDLPDRYVAARSAGLDADDVAHDVAHLPDGGAAVAGFLVGEPQGMGGDFREPSRGGRDAFVARLAADGRVRWVRTFGGAGDDASRGVARSGDRLFVTGAFEGDAAFGALGARSAGASDLFVVELTLAGEVVGLATGGGPGPDAGLGIDAHAGGGVVVVGETSGGRFGGVAIPSAGAGGDALVARVEPGGRVAWVTAGGDAANDVAHGVAVRGEAVYAAAYYEGALPFGGLRLPGGPLRTGALLRLDAATGEVRWALPMQGNDVVALGVGVDARDGVYVGGYFVGVLRAGDRSATGGFQREGFWATLRER